jgi:DnaK suppressor protein
MTRESGRAHDATRAELEQLRAAVAGQVTELEADLHAVFAASQDSNADDEHDPEGSTIAYERAQLTAVLAATRGRLAEVDAALARLAAGTYGLCDRCHRPIPAGRLAIRPFARTCVACA